MAATTILIKVTLARVVYHYSMANYVVRPKLFMELVIDIPTEQVEL